MEQEQIKKLNNMCNVAYEVQLGTMLNEMSQGEGAQSDWDETDETSTAYIKNKPDMIGKKAENAVNCEIFNNTETNEVEEGSTNSHVEGRDNTVGSDASHAEGRMCKAVGENSHAENYYAQALGMHSHAEGSSTIAKGNHAHVEGACNEANGMDSHAEGRNSVAEGMFQHVQGKANIVDYEEKYLHIVGNGSDINHRSNAHTIDWHGNGWFQGVLKVGGTGQEDENAVEVATKKDLDNVAGQKGTGENAEIFNDMTNIATGEYSHAEGYNTRAISNNSSAHGKSTIAGSKAFKITIFDDSTKTYTLDSVEGLAVGDVFSLKLKNNYENYGKITAITDNVVTVDNYVAQETEGDDLFRIVAKPEIGTVDFGMGAFVEGESNKATGENSHAEGKGNTSYGKYAHTEGKGNSASYAAHAEGVNTNATGFCSHTEGQDTIATNYTSHAEGTGTEATGYTAHAEGNKTKSQGPGSHAEGSETVAGSACSHAEGEKTKAMGANSHTEGKETEAIGDGAHAEGMGTVAVFNYQHVEGKYNIKDNSSSGKYVHIVGNGYSDTTRSNAHTIDWNGVGWFKSGLKIGGNGQDDTAAVEVATKIDIDNTIGRKGTGENAEIFNDYTNNQATGAFSHAEGSYTKAIGYGSHTEGIGTTASEAYAHAEGISTTALAANSHAEGNSTHAEGNDSHAEGYLSTAKQRAAHAEGEGTIANGEAQHAEGKYNIEDTENKYAHIVGNGYFDGDQSKTFRSNAHTVDWSGNSWCAGSIKIGGSGYEDTKAKTVATVNDIETKITSTIGDVSSLLTEDKTTLVSIIQDLVTRVTALENKA